VREAMRYFSLAHAPKSSVRQRSLQNGKSASRSESVGALQMGQLRFIENFVIVRIGDCVIESQFYPVSLEQSHNHKITQ
jgi:hypothetical protein